MSYNICRAASSPPPLLSEREPIRCPETAIWDAASSHSILIAESIYESDKWPPTLVVKTFGKEAWNAIGN